FSIAFALTIFRFGQILTAIEHSFSLVGFRAASVSSTSYAWSANYLDLFPPDMKKLITSPENVVHEAMQGMVAAHGDLLKAHFDHNFMLLADAPAQGTEQIVSAGS